MLRTARRLIKNGNHEYICVALEQAARDRNKMDAIIYRLLVTHIGFLLEGEVNLDTWLFEKFCLFTRDRDVYREIRLRWIDYMIEQLKTTGEL